MTNQVNHLQEELHSLNAARSNNNNPSGIQHQQASGFHHTPPMYQGVDLQNAYRQAPLMPPSGNPQIPNPSPYTTPYQPYNNSMNNYPPQSYLNPPSRNPNNNNRRRRTNNNTNRGGFRNQHQSRWNNDNTNSRNQPQQNIPTAFNSNGNNKFNHYCWTRGKGGHPITQCRTPHPNHQWPATFNNRMGGSNEGCWN